MKYFSGDYNYRGDLILLFSFPFLPGSIVPHSVKFSIFVFRQFVIKLQAEKEKMWLVCFHCFFVP